ncbi:AI-2E family transporter [Paenibacillus paridis]|uniref:AI-2E family transporter n=1 Tax=Paenibacillus paridis TaxID=2583376 RepID=UPI001121F22B|nr:AI-2E family transporter [Paenibacillus paridis]
MLSLNRFIRWCLAIMLVLASVYLASLVDFIFKPILSLVNIVMIPLILSFFAYYMLRPIVDWMVRKKTNRTVAILVIYLVIALIGVVFLTGVWPSLREQINNLLKNGPSILSELNFQLQELEKNEFLSAYIPADFSIVTQVTDFLSHGFAFLTEYIKGLFSFISNMAITLFVFPIILFYMLKEGGNFGKVLVRALPKRFRAEGEEITGEVDKVLSGFILGRVLVNLALGVLMYIGFLIIGLPYALLLTVVAVIMNFIPFFGAILSAVPIVIIGFIESPSVAIWSIIIILLAQQIQDNVIAPYVFGKQLNIHPLTTILLVLVGGDIFGIIGIIIIIPVYMIVKIVGVKVYELFFKHSWENI